MKYNKKGQLTRTLQYLKWKHVVEKVLKDLNNFYDLV